MVNRPEDNQSRLDLQDVYSDLRIMARRFLSRERVDHTLQPTALVHEAFLRIQQSSCDAPCDTRDYMIRAARTMRLILVDHARRRNAQKRCGTGRRLQLEEALAEYEGRSADLIALDDALVRLASLDPHLAKIVELRFFGRMTAEETASVLEVSVSTVVRGWRFAKMWLYRQLAADEQDDA